MPTGGVVSLAPGINLQPNTPGVTDLGNGHISGNFLAGGFVQSYGTMAETNDNCALGTGWNVNGLGPNVKGCVGIGVKNGGAGAQFKDAGAPPTQIVQNAVAIGRGAAAQQDFCIAIGNNANATGNYFGNNDARNGLSIAIGSGASAATTNRSGAGCTIAIGSGANSTGQDQSIAFGGNATATGQLSIAFGAGAQATGQFGGAFGMSAIASALQGLTLCNALGGNNSGQNAILITSTGQANAANNVVVIGDSSQRATICGVSAGSYTRRAVNDTSPTITSADLLIAYVGITGARTVALPSASSVPAGTRFAVADESGLCSGVNTITITPTGGDTFNGGTAVMNAAYAYREFYSNGSTKWIVTGAH